VQVAESLAEVDGVLHFGDTKTHKVRTVLLPAFLREKLARHLDTYTPSAPDAVVFTSPTGAALRNGNFRSRVWKPAVAAAGLSSTLRIHDLRHTCASLLIAQGAPPLLVSRQLGHSSIQITQDRYGHLFPEQFTQLAEALDATFEQALSTGPISMPTSVRVAGVAG
jgi:integrase